MAGVPSRPAPRPAGPTPVRKPGAGLTAIQRPAATAQPALAAPAGQAAEARATLDRRLASLPVFQAVSLVLGLLYLVGLYLAWQELRAMLADDSLGMFWHVVTLGMLDAVVAVLPAVMIVIGAVLVARAAALMVAFPARRDLAHGDLTMVRVTTWLALGMGFALVGVGLASGFSPVGWVLIILGVIDLVHGRSMRNALRALDAARPA